MSNLQQATVKLILDALHSSNLTIESFVIMAISAETSLKVLSRIQSLSNFDLEVARPLPELVEPILNKVLHILR